MKEHARQSSLRRGARWTARVGVSTTSPQSGGPRRHYPAAAMVGVGDFLHEDALVEIGIEAEIPDDDWVTGVITNTE